MLLGPPFAAKFGHRCLPSYAQAATMDVIVVLPVLAAGFAVPQFAPQILKLHRTNDAMGLSTGWAVLTSINNAAWVGYFATSRYWFALIPSTAAVLGSGCLGVMLNRRRKMRRRSRALICTWTIVLGVAASIDRRLLGALLTGGFLIQVIPAVFVAYRTRRPTAIARGTWRLVLGELSCWAVFGTAKHDGPLIVIGATGVISALLMLNRVRTTASQAAAGGEHTDHRRRLVHHAHAARPATLVAASTSTWPPSA
jgi:PQ loop repeat